MILSKLYQKKSHGGWAMPPPLRAPLAWRDVRSVRGRGPACAVCYLRRATLGTAPNGRAAAQNEHDARRSKRTGRPSIAVFVHPTIPPSHSQPRTRVSYSRAPFSFAYITLAACFCASRVHSGGTRNVRRGRPSWGH